MYEAKVKHCHGKRVTQLWPIIELRATKEYLPFGYISENRLHDLTELRVFDKTMT